MHHRNTLIALAATLLTLATAAEAGAQESKQRLTVLGFDKDASHMLVKIDDNNFGLGLRLYDTETGAPAKRSRLIEYNRGDEVATIKKAKRRYKIKDDGIEDMKTADEKLHFFSICKEDNLIVAVTDLQRLGKLTAFPRRQDPETGDKAKALLKTIYWTADRKLMVLVVEQKLKGSYVVEKEYLHALKFKPDRISWVKSKEGKGKDEEKKDEDEPWYKFW